MIPLCCGKRNTIESYFHCVVFQNKKKNYNESMISLCFLTYNTIESYFHCVKKKTNNMKFLPFRVMMKNLKKEAGRETRRTEFILEEGEEGVGLGSREG